MCAHERRHRRAPSLQRMAARVDDVTAGRGCAILNVDSRVWEEKAEGRRSVGLIQRDFSLRGGGKKKKQSGQNTASVYYQAEILFYYFFCNNTNLGEESYPEPPLRFPLSLAMAGNLAKLTASLHERHVSS